MATTLTAPALPSLSLLPSLPPTFTAEQKIVIWQRRGWPLRLGLFGFNSCSSCAVTQPVVTAVSHSCTARLASPPSPVPVSKHTHTHTHTHTLHCCASMPSSKEWIMIYLSQGLAIYSLRAQSNYLLFLYVPQAKWVFFFFTFSKLLEKKSEK